MNGIQPLLMIFGIGMLLAILESIITDSEKLKLIKLVALLFVIGITLNLIINVMSLTVETFKVY